MLRHVGRGCFIDARRREANAQRFMIALAIGGWMQRALIRYQQFVILDMRRAAAGLGCARCGCHGAVIDTDEVVEKSHCHKNGTAQK